MKIGIDLVKIDQVERIREDKNAIEKVFLVSEFGRSESMAGKLAIKEAFFKAQGEKIDWLRLEVKKEQSGQPRLFLDGELFESATISISHDGDYAVGVVVIS